MAVSAVERARRWAAMPMAPTRPCGCTMKWLTEISMPVSANAAVERACPCCGAGIVAYVDVCPARLALC